MADFQNGKYGEAAMNLYSGNYTGKVCPRCGNPNCQLISETDYKGGKYGFCKGICGYIIFGLPGILCGLCGMESESKTRSYWVCPNCDHKFKV